MPRKIRLPVPRAENRQSQQRSRQRHREYVASLEKRLSEYETRDAQATAEMQRAARAVVLKNQRLLALLAIHGVEQDEIDAFLRNDGIGAALKAGDSRPPQDSLLQSTAVNVNVPLGRLCSLQPTSDWATASVASPMSPVISSSCLPESTSLNCPTSSDQATRSESMMDTPASSSSSDQSAGEVMSCDAAATIIANLQNHGDMARARAKLGCAGPGACLVKNTDLFELIDQVS